LCRDKTDRKVREMGRLTNHAYILTHHEMCLSHEFDA
jgi:hypothetical protein